VAKPPATARPDGHCARAAGPIWAAPGVEIVALIALGLGTPRWQLA